MQRIKCILVVVPMFVSALSACSAQSTQVPPTASPTPTIEPGHAITSGELDLPLNEAEVPRISVEEARAALESGEAVIVDVRSPGAFETSHIAGASSVPLGEIERNITGLTLDKEQWIITYCT
jgi:hypothetical protein